MFLVLYEFQENVQNIVPHHRIKTAGGLIQNQQLRPVRKRHCDAKLHLHSLGKGLDLFIRGKLKTVQVFSVQAVIPLLIRCLRDFSDLGRCQRLVEIDTVEYNTDIFLQLLCRGQFLPPEGHSSVILMNQIQNGVDCGTLAGAVFTDQPHNRSFRN